MLDEALRALLAAPPHGVKVIVTTRVAPRGLLLDHPERQRRLDLDEGLGSPYAEQVLRARDPDGRLGLKTAPDELLDQARERTRGYPRALEALAAILAADRGTTLPELLDQTAAAAGQRGAGAGRRGVQPARPAGPAGDAGAGHLPGAGAAGGGGLPAAALPARRSTPRRCWAGW